MSLTIHYINDQFNYVTVNAMCVPFPGSHTARHVADKINEILKEIKFPISRVVCCVMDNEATANAAGDLLECPWHGCIDHLIELITGEAYTNNDGATTRARALVGHYKSSSSATALLQEQQRVLNPSVVPKCVIQDVATRWWSTYAMVERLLYLKDAIMVLHVTKRVPCSVSEDDWSILEQLEKILRPFMQLQKFFEGQEYVTISIIPAVIKYIRKTLTGLIEEMSQPNHATLTATNRLSILNVVQKMSNKFIERWGSGFDGTVFIEHETRGPRNIRKGIPLLVFLASALDPRFKILYGVPPEDKRKVWEALIKETHSHFLAISPLENEVITPNTEPINKRPRIVHDILNDLLEDETEQEVPTDDGGNSLLDRIRDEVHRYKALPSLPYQDDDQKPTDPLAWWKEKQVRLHDNISSYLM
tara:strand:- start:1144 stop:2400 length:1257 start_codon:yes stop_codon:yes gene_type:complete